MTQEEFNELLKNRLELNDTFQFGCKACGKCCQDRNDIILSPIDIIRLSVFFERSCSYILKRFCRITIGNESTLPVVTLDFSKTNGKCPFLSNRKCRVHNVKPAVCALYPLGRYWAFSEDKQMEYHYFLQPVDCGNKTETHIVKDWVAKILPYNNAYRIWSSILTEWAPISNEVHEKLSGKYELIKLFEIWMTNILYLYYNNTDDIAEQLLYRKIKLDQRKIEIQKLLF